MSVCKITIEFHFLCRLRSHSSTPGWMKCSRRWPPTCSSCWPDTSSGPYRSIPTFRCTARIWMTMTMMARSRCKFLANCCWVYFFESSKFIVTLFFYSHTRSLTQSGLSEGISKITNRSQPSANAASGTTMVESHEEERENLISKRESSHEYD